RGRVSMAEAERNHSPEHQTGPRTSSDLKAPILLVDDHRANLIAFEEVLKDPRHHLITASSGREALTLVEQTDFAAILLDVRMPELNGYDTAALIRRRTRSKAT